MNYKSLNEAIRSVTNPQPKNEALHSLQENIDLYNAVLPYTVGLQSVLVLVMIETLLDGSGPISGTVSLFKNLMKKWKARVLGGQLSADEGQSFIAEYEKLAASLPTGKRNFLKASLNKMEQAAKAGDKGKLGAIATEVKNYLARNSAEVKEDYQTPQRKAEGEKDIKNLTGTYKRRIKKAAGIPNPHVRSKASDDALERANDALTNLSNRTAKHETERRSTELYGHRGKIIKKKATVKEDYQTRERDRQIANLGKPVPAIDSKEKASKKVYGKDGRVEHKSLADMLKKANKKSTVKEEQEYTELLETIIVTIANELNIPPQELIEGFLKEELSEGLRNKIMHGLKVAVTGGALLAGTVGAAHQVAKHPEWTTPRHHSPSSQVQKADSKTTQSTSAAKAKAKAKTNSDDYYPSGQIIRGVDNSSLFSN